MICLQNNNIAKAVRKWRIVLFLFFIGQIILAVVVNVLVNNFVDVFEMDKTKVSIATISSNIFVAIVALFQDGYLLRRIYRTKKLLKVIPVKCVVEDFIITNRRHDRKKHYHVNLLIRDPDNGQLYFTYGPHSLSFYNSVYIQSGQKLSKISILRKDRTQVQLGDVVWLYILKEAKVSVKIKINRLLLNGKEFSYENVNPEISTESFQQVRFVEAAVDVENP